ncbi:MAG: efflux RND transporter periplasmic adaptor subunit [Acidobacteria bacterium]|nr:efflux RND transporter periplasmic adaptor subunit [Acidobacteriota bacterium]
MSSNEKHSSKPNTRRWALLLLVIVVGGLALWRLWPSATHSEAVAPAAAAQPETPKEADAKTPAHRVTLSAEALKRAQLEYGTVATQSFAQTLDVTGRLSMNEDATVRVGTFVAGRVTRVLATVGDTVKKGQALVYIHSHELLDARANDAKARAMVTEKEKQLAYAKAELERAERLLEAKAISKREQAHAVANVVAATGELEQARAELTRASEWLEHLTVPHDSHDDIVIYASASGVVLQRLVTLGTVVAENADLMTIGNVSTLWAIAEVPEAQAAFIRLGQAVELTLPAFGEDRLSAKVVHVGTALSPETRTVQVRCLVNNPSGKLRPEMYAKISLTGSAAQPVIAIPREAVQEVQGEQVVFLSVGEGAFEKRAVQMGREQKGQVEIVSGLSAGERIVTRGGFFIKSEFLKSSLAEE